MESFSSNLAHLNTTYRNSLLQPYYDALAPADSIEALTAWIPLVLSEEPEQAAELIKTISQTTDVELAKREILDKLAALTANDASNDVTPWDYASNHNITAQRLFGPNTNTIPVTVLVGNHTYIHDLTEEFTYGLLLGLNKSPNFTIEISGAEINQQMLDRRYTPNSEVVPGSYRAETPQGVIEFKTPEFVQGIITAAQWTDQDPHAIIRHLLQFNNQGFGISLDFNL